VFIGVHQETQRLILCGNPATDDHCRIVGMRPIAPLAEALSVGLKTAQSLLPAHAMRGAKTVRFWSDPLPSFRRFATIQCEKDTPVDACRKQAQAADLVDFIKQGLEARAGIEPAHKGFADLSLTTWVPRLGRAA
jgi:hypothetical protein